MASLDLCRLALAFVARKYDILFRWIAIKSWKWCWSGSHDTQAGLRLCFSRTGKQGFWGCSSIAWHCFLTWQFDIIILFSKPQMLYTAILLSKLINNWKSNCSKRKSYKHSSGYTRLTQPQLKVYRRLDIEQIAMTILRYMKLKYLTNWDNG